MKTTAILHSDKAIKWARFCVAYKERTGESPVEITGSHLGCEQSQIMAEELLECLKRELSKIDNEPQ